MEFWLFAACLTIAATLIVLLPLSRRKTSLLPADNNDLEVYRDQMREIDADAARGQIDSQSAEQARLEIARRLLKAEKGSNTVELRQTDALWQRSLAMIAVLSVPLISWGIYSSLGSPELSSQPLAARLAASAERSPVDELVARAEGHLAENPGDGRGWDVLAPIYLRLGRVDDSIKAFRNATRLLGEDFSRSLGLAESLTLAAGGTITDEAQELFEKAASLDPADIRPQFFLARALTQDGRSEEAANHLQVFLDKAPADAPWRSQLAETITRMRTLPAPAGSGPTADDVKAAAAMSDKDRATMIETMVSGLDAKLAANPDDLDGWKQLIRSYMIMERKDEAIAALKRGQNALSAAKQLELADYAKTLDLEAGSTTP